MYSSKAALEVVVEEDLSSNAFEMGKIFRNELNDRLSDSNIVKLVREEVC